MYSMQIGAVPARLPHLTGQCVVEAIDGCTGRRGFSSA